MNPLGFEDWERQRIDRSLGVVCTLNPDGTPHAVPVQVWFEGDTLRFRTDPGSRKLRNLRRNPAIAVCVFGQPQWGVLIRGKAEILQSGSGDEQAQVRVVASGKVSWRRKEG